MVKQIHGFEFEFEFELVPVTELSLRAGCISNLRFTVVFKKIAS